MNDHPVLRFTAGERIFHWTYFITFVILALTGAFLYLPATPFSAGEAGETSRLIHRIFAVAFLASPVLPLIITPRGYLRNLREAFTWHLEDVRSLVILVGSYYWTGRKGSLPPQGKFTAGQKLHVVLQFVASCVLGVTGLLVWWHPVSLTVPLFREMLILHELSAIVVFCFVLTHIYMVTLQPLTNEAIAAMTLGTVSEAYVRDNHPRWYAALQRAGRRAP